MKMTICRYVCLVVGVMLVSLSSCIGVRKSEYRHSMLVGNDEINDDFLYYNVKNRVRVLLSGVEFEDLELVADSCTIEKTNKRFLITPLSDVSVLIKCAVNGVVVDSFRKDIKYVPITGLSIGGLDPHGMRRGEVAGQIYAWSNLSQPHQFFSVISYEFRLVDQTGKVFSGKMKGNNIRDNERIKKEYKPGTTIILSNVQLKLEKGFYPLFPCEKLFYIR